LERGETVFLVAYLDGLNKLELETTERDGGRRKGGTNGQGEKGGPECGKEGGRAGWREVLP